MAQLMPDGAAIAHETASPWVSRAIPTTSSALPVSTSTLPHTGYRIHLTPLLDQPGTYRFAALTRELRGSGDKLFIGRDKDRSDAGGAHELLFRSKVVSHAHAEVILDGGRLFIRDTGSLHGTSLNQLRLSSARRVSKLRQLRDGDIIQLGTDRAYGVVQHDRFVRAKVKIEKIVSEQGGLSV
ncbi:SMAD/FHA domain-containing protein [Phlebopus sp. FC_14]|nr:SMAD/FHA domain-containing protein [Phlebopus sp. FC_14]